MKISSKMFKNESSIENPFAYFEELYQKDGVAYLENSFLNYEKQFGDEGSGSASRVDSKEENLEKIVYKYTYQSGWGESITEEINFEQFLERSLLFQVKNTKGFLKEKLEKIMNESGYLFCINKFNSSLKKCFLWLENTSGLKCYDVYFKVLEDLNNAVIGYSFVIDFEPHISDNNKNDLPDIELKTQKEQIRLLYELGIIDFLQNKYPNSLKNNNNQTADLISKFLKIDRSSVQPTLNALLIDSASNKNYPKITSSINSILAKLNSNESI